MVGVLHSTEYRARFARDLKKMLPRSPSTREMADFRRFSHAGPGHGPLAPWHRDPGAVARGGARRRTGAGPGEGFPDAEDDGHHLQQPPHNHGHLDGSHPFSRMSDALADLREAGSGLSGTTPSPRRRGTRMGSARLAAPSATRRRRGSWRHSRPTWRLCARRSCGSPPAARLGWPRCFPRRVRGSSK